MASYLVKATAYIDGKIVLEGETIEFAGKVRDEDEHLELVKDPANKRKAKEESDQTDADVRAEAIKAKLVDDGNHPISDNTPIDVVTRKLAEFKQANAFR